jgi:hypothetical protein
MSPGIRYIALTTSEDINYRQDVKTAVTEKLNRNLSQQAL